MAEYIKREDVLDALCNASVPTFNLFGKPILDVNYVPAINAIPAADVVERKTGKWMPIIEANEYGETYQAGCYCSECDEVLQYEPNFCPNCGAKMREES